jgi:hypothetical protein
MIRQVFGEESMKALKKVRKAKSEIKSVPIIFFDIKGILHKEFGLAGQTVNSTYYYDVCSDCMKTWEDLTPNCGYKRTGCCMKTKQYHISFFTRGFILPKNSMTVAPPPTPLFSVSLIEDKSERPPF